MDGPSPIKARLSETIKLVFAALADPAQRPAAVAARARLYPRNSATVLQRGILEAEACLGSSFAYVLLKEIDLAYDMANQCLDAKATTSSALFSRTGLNALTMQMRPFRQDPRFQAFATRLGLMPYWQKYGPPDDCDLKDGKLTCH